MTGQCYVIKFVTLAVHSKKIVYEICFYRICYHLFVRLQ